MAFDIFLCASLSIIELKKYNKIKHKIKCKKKMLSKIFLLFYIFSIVVSCEIPQFFIGNAVNGKMFQTTFIEKASTNNNNNNNNNNNLYLHIYFDILP